MMKKGRPSRPTPQPLGAVLDELVLRRRWGSRLNAATVFDLWPQIAGETICENAEVIRLHGGVLVLKAKDPSWATQLKYLSGEIQTKTNSLMGPNTVRSVSIVLGDQQ